MRPVRLMLCTLFCLTTFLVAAPSSAQEGEFGLQAAIREGACDDRGDRIAGLEAPAFQSGSEEGSNDGQSALVSVTTVDVPIEDLLDNDSIIAITREGQSGVDACGAIGGVQTRRDVLVIQVGELGDSGVWGIAILTPNDDDPDQTDIALYLGGTGLEGRAEPDPEPTARPSNGDDDDDDDDNGNNEQPAELDTIESPNFGFSVSYDPETWEVVNELATSDSGIDTFSLGAGFTTVYFSGIPATADAERCVEVLSDTESSADNVLDSAPLEDEDGNAIAGGDANDAFTGLVLQREASDGTEVSQAVYMRCIVLVPGEALLTIQQYSSAELYPLADVLRESLLTGLELP